MLNLTRIPVTNFNENDRKRLYEINNTVKLLVEEVKSLKTEIERTNRKAKRLEIENERLKKSVNLSLFKIDALELWRAILIVMFYIGNITLPRNVTTLCEHVLYSKYNELRSRRVLVVINYKLRLVKVK